MLTIRAIRSSAALVFMGSITEAESSIYVKALTTMSLHRIYNYISDVNCWTFSISFDSATALAISYVDMRIRYYDNIRLQNYHVLAIPIYDTHGEENMYNLIATLIYSLCADFLEIKANRSVNRWCRKHG